MGNDRLSSQVLLQLPVFEGLTEAEVAELMSRASLARFPKGRPIFSEGEPGDALFAILEGTVEVRMRGPERSELTIAVLGLGAVLGEMALLTNESRSASAVPTEDTVLFCLYHRDFVPLLAEGSLWAYKVVYNLAKVLGHRLRSVDEKLVELMGREPAAGPERFEELAALKTKLFTEWSF
ncbi:MAG: cyclic nucleotide-binding domain-containing protein [Chloroflexi bacterium]|nr:cyclic nucleotide-binding domain-containing protein [Chloroflexota bacterium]